MQIMSNVIHHLHMQGGCTADSLFVYTLTKETPVFFMVSHVFLLMFGLLHWECLEVKTTKFYLGNSNPTLNRTHYSLAAEITGCLRKLCKSRQKTEAKSGRMFLKKYNLLH